MEAVKGRQSTEEDLRAWVDVRSCNVCVDCDGEKRESRFIPWCSTKAAHYFDITPYLHV